jgi:DNA-binding LytR/AlgR family response regulator
MTIRCLVADDEPLALQLIAGYIAKIPHLVLVGTCKNATEIPMYTGQVDLLFLDIRMPGLTGIELLRSMREKPMVVLITAYSEYALEGFELDVLDYLVKPVSFERFMLAISKATHLYELQHRGHPTVISAITPENIINDPPKAYFFVKSGFKSVRVNFGDITYIEGLKEYVTIFTSDNKKYVKLAAMKDLEAILPGKEFLRIHKSYIVSIKKVTAAYGNTIEIGTVSLPVGRNYKEVVQKIFC